MRFRRPRTASAHRPLRLIFRVAHDNAWQEMKPSGRFPGDFWDRLSLNLTAAL